MYKDSLVLFEPLFERGNLVALSVEPIHIDEKGWLQFASAIEAMATELGLAFGPSENMAAE